MVYFTLKLVRKAIGLVIGLVKLPFRILKLLLGLRSDGDEEPATEPPPDPNSTATDSDGAAATERQASPAEAADTEAWTNYERFRKSLYAYAGFGLLLYVLVWIQFGFAAPSLGPVAVSVALPAALGYWARGRSRIAWGVGMAYAGLFVLVSIGSVGVVSTLGPTASRALQDALGGGVIAVFGLLSLLQIGSLLAGLYFGVVGRSVAFGEATTVDPEAATGDEPDDPAAQESAVGSADGAGARPTAGEGGSSATPDAPSHEAAASAPAPGTSGAAATNGIDASVAESADDAGVADGAGSTSDGVADDSEPADSGATGDSEPADDRTANREVVALAEEATETRSPATVRELGERASADPVPEPVVSALAACADDGDPDVRVAVCDACGALGGEETRDIVGRLRIDSNDRVATAAMDAY